MGTPMKNAADKKRGPEQGKEKGSPISKAPVKRHSLTSTRHFFHEAASGMTASLFSRYARVTQPHPGCLRRSENEGQVLQSNISRCVAGSRCIWLYQFVSSVGFNERAKPIHPVLQIRPHLNRTHSRHPSRNSSIVPSSFNTQ
jgi:hypothetical protein